MAAGEDVGITLARLEGKLDTTRSELAGKLDTLGEKVAAGDDRNARDISALVMRVAALEKRARDNFRIAITAFIAPAVVAIAVWVIVGSGAKP